MTASHDEVVAFLSSGASYGFEGATVERIETHCSLIFLVADRAFKVKRPVAFSSLDYTTIEKREAACRAELELNRRTAPGLYLGIHAIRRRAGGELAFDGDGEALEWVVFMRRFDQADLFDCLADTGRLTPDLIGALAEEMAQFHEAAERAPGFGGADGLRITINCNLRDQQTVEPELPRGAVTALHQASLSALERMKPLLDRRRREGWVRRCHGDLRLANVCLLDGRPTLFDAIEFSDEVSCIDVLFDLAFLLMDLHSRGSDVLSNMLFNRYLDLIGESEGLPALPLMLSVRAASRAYTLAAASRRRTRPGEVRRYTAAARSHLALASLLLAETPARLIAIGGVRGSTKALIASALAASFRPAPGARVLRSDVARHRLLDLPPKARPSAEAYDERVTVRVYGGLAAEAERIVRAEFTAVVEASFVRAAERDAIAAAAVAASVPFVGLWIGSAQGVDAGRAEGGDWHVIKDGPGLATTLATARLLSHGRAQD